MEDNKTGAFLSGLFWGALAGFVVGILYAPRSGVETREILKEKTKELGVITKDKIEDVKSRGRDLLTGKGIEITEESEE
ncbi:MAG: YtxH domain-containing protein [Caldisericaceae bacterium]|jgi:gas vesicle protein|nr:YtxH domain-containing protein [Caldisericaceae bacterium]